MPDGPNMLPGTSIDTITCSVRTELQTARMLFKPFLGLFDVIFGLTISNIDFRIDFP